MSCQAKPFLRVSRFEPGAENQWHCGFPARSDPGMIRKQFPKAVPWLRHWTHAGFVAAISEKRLQGIAFQGRGVGSSCHRARLQSGSRVNLDSRKWLLREWALHRRTRWHCSLHYLLRRSARDCEHYQSQPKQLAPVLVRWCNGGKRAVSGWRVKTDYA